MTDNFCLAQGYEVSDISSVKEGYHLKNNNFTVSISHDKLISFINDITDIFSGDVFFFIEVPSQNEYDDISMFHKDIYYLDNCTHDVAKAIMKRYGDLLINDGVVQFGFGSHKSNDEIYIMKYNVINIYASETNIYRPVFIKHNINEDHELITIWDVLSDENQGRLTSIDFDSEDIYTIIENLTDVGLYFSHTAEDK